VSHEITGRKVFILNPHSVVTDELVEMLLAAEYEVYLLKDREKALRVFHQFPDSVLFINVDSGAKDDIWEAYVRKMIEDPKLKTIRIGILSYNPSAELARKYLIDIGVPCGFVRLRLGVTESARIMLKALKANEAKGRRKYVRVQVGQDKHAGFNVTYGGSILEGTILDISAVGMAAKFHTEVDIPPNSRIPELQLRLRTSLVRVTGIILNRRTDDKSVYVLLFEHSVETKARHQIRMYIHNRLQEEVNRISGEHA
jgi:PilZ domain-containing protein